LQLIYEARQIRQVLLEDFFLQNDFVVLLDIYFGQHNIFPFFCGTNVLQKSRLTGSFQMDKNFATFGRRNSMFFIFLRDGRLPGTHSSIIGGLFMISLGQFWQEKF
jgi:hypothetical protein